jgi:hypothetical protein
MQRLFEMHRAFPGLRGLGKLAQIRDLGQVAVGQVGDWSAIWAAREAWDMGAFFTSTG